MNHASATPVRPEVLEAMLPYYTEHFGNPSTVYDIGSEIKRDIDKQREKVGSL
ncbi:aminotransferase class V-fold PLP-dependent enzyme, partial [Thermodesulfobacteriota bacterium]